VDIGSLQGNVVRTSYMYTPAVAGYKCSTCHCQLTCPPELHDTGIQL